MQLPDIVAANSAAHAAFITTFESALAAFTALDCATASAQWGELAAQIAAHQAVEEELLAALAAYPDLASPRGGATSLVLAEHQRLDHLHTVAAQQIAAVGATPLEARRLAMVRVLDDVLRFRHLLEHHGLREEQIVYPHLMATLPSSLCASFAERLLRL